MGAEGLAKTGSAVGECGPVVGVAPDAQADAMMNVATARVACRTPIGGDSTTLKGMRASPPTLRKAEFGGG